MTQFRVDTSPEASLAGDRAARQLAQTEFAKPLILEAGAGTGKTATLVARIVVWSLGSGWACAEQFFQGKGDKAEPHRVAQRVLQRTVAITFTEKAAAEMAQRVAEYLLCLSRAEVDASALPSIDLSLLPLDTIVRQLRARELLSAIDQLSVSTFHAFCRRLLSEFPLEAGLHPEFQLDSETGGDGMLREIVGAALEKQIRQEVVGARGPLFELGKRGMELAGFADVVVEMKEAGVMCEDLEQNPLAPEAFCRLRDRVLAFLEEWNSAQGELLSKLAKSEGVKRTGAIRDALERSLELFRAWQDFSVGEFARVQEECFDLWEGTASNGLDDWAREKWGKGEQSVLDKYSEEDAHLLRENAIRVRAILKHIQDLDLEGLRVLHEALALLLREVQAATRTLGVESFSDLLRDARDLLRDHASVAGLVRDRIDQLLVDEFQDTDSTQCDLIEILALQGPPEARPGLFLVGDPKQSIYGWRNADLRAYDDFLDKVSDVRHPLTVNYRSLPPILAEVERVIDPIMKAEHGLQPRFIPLLCSEAKASSQPTFSEPHATVEYWVTQENGSGEIDKKGELAIPQISSEVKAKFEAQALARDLRVLYEKKEIAWNAVGVLFRSFGHLEIYLRELRNAGIPYVVEGGKQYYLRREVIEATSLVCAILDPNDLLSLLAWMRSAWVGVPDAALPLLWAHDFPKHTRELHGKVSDELFACIDLACAELQAKQELVAFAGLERIAGWEESLKAALQTLGALRQSLAEDCAEDFLEKIRHLTLIEPLEAARFLGAFRLANLDRFFEGLQKIFEMTHGNVGEILHALRDPIRVQREVEDARPRTQLESAVQVMTIHAAKGLDFEHVYLVQMHKGAGNQGGKAIVERFAQGVEYSALGLRTLGMDEAEAQKKKTEACERVRALYVAMTRAKQRLVLLGDWPVNPQSVSRASRFSDLFPHRRDGWINAQAILQRLTQASAKDAEPQWFCDEQSTRWVFPALRRADLDVFSAAASVSEPIGHALHKEASVERVRELRTHAVRCQARPFAIAASRAAKFLDEDGVSAFAATEESANALETVRTQSPPATTLESVTQKRVNPPTLPGASAEVLSSEVARTVGTALHRVLEEIDLACRDPHEALAAQRARLTTDLQALPNAILRKLALDKANALLDGLATNGILQRLFALRDQIVARELALLLPPTLVDLGESGPVGFISGTLDLLYREPATAADAIAAQTPKTENAGKLNLSHLSHATASRWVVVDYKTDAVTTQAEVDERAQRYALQGELYCRAVQQALGLSEKPRFELWFLAAGEIRSVA